MKAKNIDKETLRDLESSLSEELKRLEPVVLKRASLITGEEVSVHSLHGYLGGKNNQYVDSIRSQFPSPDDFISQWINGLLERVNEIEDKQRERYNGNIYQDTPTHRMVRLVKDQKIFDYLITFLKRNFYRNLNERTRAKPNEIHWALWFAENQIPWGLIIAPVYRNGRWTNDVSEIRRASYMYWTVGHVLTTGLIDPDSTDRVFFLNLHDFIIFYNSVLKRLSRSQYEKQIVDRYLNYLRESEAPEQVPFLIPELRYAGLDRDHLYRIDFSLLNSHTMEYVGFEMSPQSTHMAVASTKDKKQKDINQELKIKWNKEVAKRNKYFLDYGITTITFSDEDFKDIDGCFDVVRQFLSKRPKKSLSLKQRVKDLKEFKIH